MGRLPTPRTARTMNDAGAVVSMVAGRPRIAGRKVPTADDRQRRRLLWPSEVRDGGKGVFKRPHRLRYDGRLYQLEVRSKRGRGFWIMVAGKAVVRGATESIALAAASKAIDPTVEVVNDLRGRRLA
jgi:hypothetical protein